MGSIPIAVVVLMLGMYVVYTFWGFRSHVY